MTRTPPYFAWLAACWLTLARVGLQSTRSTCPSSARARAWHGVRCVRAGPSVRNQIHRAPLAVPLTRTSLRPEGAKAAKQQLTLYLKLYSGAYSFTKTKQLLTVCFTKPKQILTDQIVVTVERNNFTCRNLASHEPERGGTTLGDPWQLCRLPAADFFFAHSRVGFFRRQVSPPSTRI